MSFHVTASSPIHLEQYHSECAQSVGTCILGTDLQEEVDINHLLWVHIYLPSCHQFNLSMWFIDWNCLKPTMLISSVIHNIMCSNFNCILLLFSQPGLDLQLSYNRDAEWIVDPPIWNTADTVRAVTRAIGWSSSDFTVCLKKVWHVSLC